MLDPQFRLLFLGVGWFAAALFLILLWRHFRSNRPTISRRHDITAILERALLRRGRMDITLHPDKNTQRTISGNVFEITDTKLTLEMRLEVKPSRSWVGERVVCFFHVFCRNQLPMFYSFTSSIHDVRPNQDILYLTLHFPSRIKTGQKRKHLRVDIPPVDIKKLRISPSTESEQALFETQLDKWNTPLATYTPQKRAGLRIKNLSARGLRLGIDLKRHIGLDDLIINHPLLFLFLELEPADDVLCPPLMLQCRLRHKIMDCELTEMMLGYEFCKSAIVDAKGNLIWTVITPERGIEDLGRWVFKRHQLLYREGEMA